MNTTKEWIEKYETVKHLLVAPMNYAEVFEKNEIHGKKLFVFRNGRNHISYGRTFGKRSFDLAE